MKNFLRFFVIVAISAFVLESQSRADVTLTTFPVGGAPTDTVLDSDDPNLPDPDPTTLTAALGLFTIDGPSIANVSGENIGGVFLEDNAELNVTAGSVGPVNASGFSSINVLDGSVTLSSIGDDSTLVITDGQVSSAAPILGGLGGGPSFGIIDGTVELNGGTFTGGVDLGGLFTVSGGDVSGAIFELSGGSLALDGSGFQLTVTNPDGTQSTSAVGGVLEPLDFGVLNVAEPALFFALTGTLDDGTSFSIDSDSLSFQALGSTVILPASASVPEPASASVLCLVGLSMLSRRKRRNSSFCR